MTAPKPPVFWIAATALVIATVVAYAPARGAGFIWDDEAHVTPVALRSWRGLGRIWFQPGATQQYYPLLHSAFWLEHRLWGGAPLGYHLANITFHATAAVLLAALLRRLALRGAMLAALIFAVHPVHVESVAWISEQKNTLSAIFYLGAALAYLRFDVRRAASSYALALALFVLGLLTKTVIATLPAALLVVLWCQRGALSWRRDVRPVGPWFVLGVAAGLFTVWVERKLIGAEGAAFDLTLLQRALLAGRVVWFYLAKLVWPGNLTFIYPRWSIDPANPSHWLPLAAAAGVIVFLWRIRTRFRGPLAAALLFGGSLFPALGLFNVYPFQYSFVADHFQYLATIPAIALAAAAVSHSRLGCGSRGRAWPRAAVCLLGAALVTMTWQQSRIYRDNQTLFRATVERNPAAWMAWNNLGKELMTARPGSPEAIGCLERAIALRRDYPEAHNNLGLVLTQAGRPREAIPHFETSLRLKPNSFQTHNNLGIALASSGRSGEALRAFARAAALNPTLPNIHENWARALVLLGRNAEAEERFAHAARLRNSPAP